MKNPPYPKKAENKAHPGIFGIACVFGAISGLQSSVSTANEYESGEYLTMDDSYNILKNVAIDTAVSAVSTSVAGSLDGKVQSEFLKKAINVGIEGIKETYEYSTEKNRSGKKYTSRDIQEYVLSNHLPEILWNVFKGALFE